MQKEPFFPLQSAGKTTHGMHKTRTYRIWASMKSRCQDPDNAHYKDYGGRGITVCDEWQTFEQFFADMGEAPDGLTLERMDVNGTYCVANCTWASHKEQGRNKRNNRLLTIRGETMPCSAWAERVGISKELLYRRLTVQGLDPETAVFTPVKRRKT